MNPQSKKSDVQIVYELLETHAPVSQSQFIDIAYEEARIEKDTVLTALHDYMRSNHISYNLDFNLVTERDAE